MEIMAYLHSLQDRDGVNHLAPVEIVERRDDGTYIARVGDSLYTAIFNWFTLAYYVDDIYGYVGPAK